MGRLLRFLFGAALGASVAVLATPKTGRELRAQLLGPEVRRLLPTQLAELLAPPEAPPAWPEERVDEGVREDTGDIAARVGAVAVEERGPMAEDEAELTAWSGDHAEAVVEEAPAEAPAEAEGPAVFEEDLRARMDETKAAIVSEIDRPFEKSPAGAAEAAVVGAVVAEAVVAEAAVADVLADEAVVEAAYAEAAAEEAVA
ncbi:MAG TPA: YtxH domain-containing protein, partial [Thermoleophilia bacterium]|nr:YtxH domain-containing protein [Thermoleophilia bacterium]